LDGTIVAAPVRRHGLHRPPPEVSGERFAEGSEFVDLQATDLMFDVAAADPEDPGGDEAGEGLRHGALSDPERFPDPGLRESDRRELVRTDPPLTEDVQDGPLRGPERFFLFASNRESFRRTRRHDHDRNAGRWRRWFGDCQGNARVPPVVERPFRGPASPDLFDHQPERDRSAAADRRPGREVEEDQPDPPTVPARSSRRIVTGRTRRRGSRILRRSGG
jgi:hypothetical protein